MKLFADYHVHTDFSGDGTTPMEKMIDRALKLNLKQLVFTDHVDYDYADPAFEMIDYDEYLLHFNKLKEKYDDKIKLLLGVEVGFQPQVKEKINNFLPDYPFDVVIMSTHMADGLDFYNGDFFVGKEQKNAYLRYFENVLASVKAMNNYDIYGHLDFIVRYGNYARRHLSYLDYHDIVDEILKTVIKGGHGIELNTSGYRYGLEQMHPQESILMRYHDLGGEIITVGSDAHKDLDLCADFNDAYEMLKALGYKYVSTFNQRKVNFVELK
jgi:histidinol-phosphatase (PHP family)